MKLENLNLPALTDLFVSENGIEKFENLETVKALETLDVAKNRVTTIENVDGLTNLTEFWVKLRFFRFSLSMRQFLFFFELQSVPLFMSLVTGKFESNRRLELRRQLAEE